MIYRLNTRRRHASSAVEAAFILPVTFFLMYGLCIGGLLVFKYQELTHIARETARFASTHGSQYKKYNQTAITAGTQPSVDSTYLQTYAQNLTITIPSSDLNVTVKVQTLPAGSTSNSKPTNVDWDTNSSPTSSYTNGSGNTCTVTNMVIVTVSMTWTPGVYVYPGSVTLTATSTMPMSF
jgi:Flp pilus assembly protein TadG